MQPLPREFYDRDAESVARAVLGRLLCHRVGDELRAGRIVEAEAYLGPHDLAAHSSKGRTKRTEVMFGPPGHAYVYLIYGIHHCFNVVTGAEGVGSAVLIRALEPVAGIEGKTSGPGLLCKALGIDLACNRLDLTGGNLFLTGPAEDPPIEAGPRVGVDYAGEWAAKPLRFWIRGNGFVSRQRG